MSDKAGKTETVRAPRPSRATATVTLSFGMVAIPVKLYTGTEDSRIKRSRYVKSEDGKYHKVRNAYINEDTGERIEYGDIVSLVETENGPVELTNEEKDSLVDLEAGTAEIVAFVPQALLAGGHYVPEKLYQVKPDTKGSGKNKVETSGKPFDLLMAAMRKKQVCAIARVVMKSGSQPQFAALLPNERMYLIHFDNEVRADIERERNEPDAKQLEKAVSLVESMTEPNPPSFVDDTSARIMEYATKKAAGEEIDLAESTTTDVETADDLMALLDASMEA